MPRLTPQRYNVPIKGWNTITPVREMGQEYAPKLENHWFDQSGSMNRRPGQAAVTTTPLGTEITSLFEHRDLAGTSVLFGWTNSQVYKHTSTTFTQETDADVQGVFTSRPRAAQMAGALVVGDGISVRTYTSAGGWAASPTGVSPMDMFTTYNGRMYGAGDPSQRLTVYYSDNTAGAGITDWTSSGPGGFLDLSAVLGTGEEVTGLATYLGALVVFCRNAIVFYRGYGNTDPNTPGNFRVEKIIRGIGCFDHDSIQGVGNDTIFLSKYGFKKLSQVVVQGDASANHTSVPINNYIIDQFLLGNIATGSVRSTFAEKFGIYLCTFGNMTLAYHVTFDAWVAWYGLEKTLYTKEDGTVYCAGLTMQEVTTSADGDTIGAASEVNITTRWDVAPFRGEMAESKPRWNRAELIYEATINEVIQVSHWIDLDETTMTTENITLSPHTVIVEPTDFVWSTGANDPRMLWWDGAASLTKWAGGGISAQFQSGDHRIPVFGRAELFSLRVTNTNISKFKITALEAYNTGGGLR